MSSKYHNWKGVFTLFYKTQHRVVKSLSKAKPKSNEMTDEEMWNLINLIEANEYVYDLRMHLRGMEKQHHSLKDKLKHEKETHDNTKHSERYWRSLNNKEVLPPQGFLEV